MTAASIRVRDNLSQEPPEPRLEDVDPKPFCVTAQRLGGSLLLLEPIASAGLFASFFVPGAARELESVCQLRISMLTHIQRRYPSTQTVRVLLVTG
jgi:hypothetical protein